jgi:hypothetical protein
MTKTAPPVPEAGVAAWLDRWSQLGDEVQDRAVGALLAGPSGGVLGVALWLTPDPAGHGTHTQLGLGACTVLQLTGWPCPMCGMTTSFSHFAHLQLFGGLAAQPFGAFLFAATLVFFAVGSADLLQPRGRWRRLRAAALRHELALAGGLLLGMALGWLYKAHQMGLLGVSL